MAPREIYIRAIEWIRAARKLQVATAGHTEVKQVKNLRRTTLSLMAQVRLFRRHSLHIPIGLLCNALPIGLVLSFEGLSLLSSS